MAVFTQALANKGFHPSYDTLERRYPLQDRRLLGRLARLLSALAHWGPVFAEAAFLPELAFPFAKLFGAADETCFEVVATVLLNWASTWFERFPNPPAGQLGLLESILAHHDPELFGHLSEGDFLDPSELLYLEHAPKIPATPC